jgi:hypothetical protein
MTEFIRAGRQLAVTDFFRQAFTAQLHLFGQSLLAVLDPPLDEVHGVLMRDADGAAPALDYLDADLVPVATPAIAEVTVTSGESPP